MDTERWEANRQRWEQKMEAKRARWEARAARRPYRSASHGFFFGAVVIAIGVLLLLDNMGIFRIHDIWQYWPVLLVAFGVSRVLDSRTPSGWIWGGMITLIGAFLLLDTLDIIYFNFHVFWPLILIAFGLSVLAGALERSGPRAGTPYSGSPVVSSTAIFSDNKRGSDTKDFTGGQATAVFGAARFDLRNASMTVEEARIDVNVVFGEVEIRIPETWSAVNRAGVIFAGVNDKTSHPRMDPNVKTPRLVITGGVVFGAITLRN